MMYKQLTEEEKRIFVKLKHILMNIGIQIDEEWLLSGSNNFPEVLTYFSSYADILESASVDMKNTFREIGW